jgi:hypothetical protein
MLDKIKINANTWKNQQKQPLLFIIILQLLQLRVYKIKKTIKKGTTCRLEPQSLGNEPSRLPITLSCLELRKFDLYNKHFTNEE